MTTIQPLSARSIGAATYQPAAPKPPAAESDEAKVREAFQSFVGQTLFGQMLKEMRKSVHKTPYFNGGKAEEIFTQQLDQVLAEKMAKTSADRLAEPMFELFMLQRR